MTYKITLRVYQTNVNAWFRVVEKTVWNDAGSGFWTEVDGKHTLTMGGSGTSGTLRFLVVVGVHNYRRWTDVVADLTSDQTGMVINPEYYGGGTRTHGTWEQTLTTHEVHNAWGRRLAVTWFVGEGNDLRASVCFG